MKRWAAGVVLALAVLGAGIISASAGNARGYIGAFSPAWTPEGSSLLFRRGLVYLGAEGTGRYVESREHLYSIAPDGGNMRPINVGRAATDCSSDGQSQLLVMIELWTIKSGRPETLHLLWEPPEGHILLDARFAPGGSYRALTLHRGALVLWSLDQSGCGVSKKDLPGGPAYAWSPSDNIILTGGWAGLWWYPVGASKPVQLATGDRGPVDVFGFARDAGEKGYYMVGKQAYSVWPESGVLKVQAVASMPKMMSEGTRTETLDDRSPGPVTFFLPGPSSRLLTSDGTRLSHWSPAGERTGLGGLSPDGRAGWTADGRIAVFSVSGDMFRYSFQSGKAEPVGPGYDPVPAPSGNLTAFWRMVEGLPQVFVLDGTGAQSMQTAKGGKNPCWLSEDELALLAWDGGGWQVAAMKRNSRSPAIQTTLHFYTAQLAAFSSFKEARLFAEACAAFSGTLPVYLVTADVGGTRWYRVRLGIFESVQDLETALSGISPELKRIPAWDGKYFVSRASNEYGWLWASPDGSAIVFEAMGILYRFERSKEALRVLWKPRVLSPWAIREAALSPDGSRLAFIDESGRLNIMPAAGGPAKVILEARPF